MAAIIGRKLEEGAAGLAHAAKYCRAAQTEEKNGFAFTAAVEWQEAAQLLAPFPSLADHCWQQWERIMRLPRQLADPVAETQATNPQISDPGRVQFNASCLAGCSESEIAETIASIAESSSSITFRNLTETTWASRSSQRRRKWPLPLDRRFNAITGPACRPVILARTSQQLTIFNLDLVANLEAQASVVQPDSSEQNGQKHAQP
jgi:hypothetical protein